MSRWLRLGRGRTGYLAVGVVTLLVMTLCGQVSAASKSGKTTITFAESGLGTEGAQTQKAINGFEKANPNIHVSVLVLSPNSTTFLQQLEQRFIAGSTSPDVLESDVTYPATFGKAGWIKNLDSLKPNLKRYFKTEVAAGQYKGHTYAIPWFDNPEGLFYRTDLIKTPPTSPAEVVTDAEAAMKADPTLKEGLAFEGEKYEGAVTMFATLEGAFGGKLNPADLDTKGNRAALQWLYDALYVNKIAPLAVTGWQEGQVETEFQAGYAAFAIDYPFVESSVLTAGGPAKGHVGYIPFPAVKGGTPGSALGGEMLAINAKSTHVAADWKLINYLTSSKVETARAEATGDPPALPAAYTSALLKVAPYFAQVETLNKYSQPRPVNPNYLQISSDLQTMFSSVISKLNKPDAALAQTAPIVKAAAKGSGSK
jgi:multiple sugar transport system substrate-binding protein